MGTDGEWEVKPGRETILHQKQGWGTDTGRLAVKSTHRFAPRQKPKRVYDPLCLCLSAVRLTRMSLEFLCSELWLKGWPDLCPVA